MRPTFCCPSWLIPPWLTPPWLDWPPPPWLTPPGWTDPPPRLDWPTPPRLDWPPAGLTPPPLWTDRRTDTCQNITFPLYYVITVAVFTYLTYPNALVLKRAAHRSTHRYYYYQSLWFSQSYCSHEFNFLVLFVGKSQWLLCVCTIARHTF